jgi:hypothetical protein
MSRPRTISPRGLAGQGLRMSCLPELNGDLRCSRASCSEETRRREAGVAALGPRPLKACDPRLSGTTHDQATQPRRALRCRTIRSAFKSARPGRHSWRAELAIRFGVILRKVWEGIRTWAGARAQSVLAENFPPLILTCWAASRTGSAGWRAGRLRARLPCEKKTFRAAPIVRRAPFRGRERASTVRMGRPS